ncbi:MAG TPA: glycine oxidase ThiO [Candidatus Limnocylindrales bacterium]|nr:glycine oxidase ThiO [Candidatus Limnocylindrales bacterium]
MSSPDVVVVGAGIIGVSLALELRARGASVTILERGAPGQEASSAAAGMLAATDPETPSALQPIASESARLYPDFVEMIERSSGMNVDFRSHGTMAIGELDTAPPEYVALTEKEISLLEPAILSNTLPVYLVAEASVDPVLLIRAALKSAGLAGVEIQTATEFREAHSSLSGVEVVTSTGTISCQAVVNCCGAWSGAPVRPRKGQMLYVRPENTMLIQHVVRAADAYIVPRSSGKILIGATVEDVGFDKRVDPATIQQLHQAASRYLPQVAKAEIISSWAGLRPGTPDDLPIMGQIEPGMFVASGHFRNGILLAPITAKLMADLISGLQPAMDLSPFSASRFAPSEISSTRG